MRRKMAVLAPIPIANEKRAKAGVDVVNCTVLVALTFRSAHARSHD
jgi:hypothetical protein